MSLDLSREPRPGDPITAADFGRLIRAIRALTPRGGPGIRVSTLPTGTTITAVPRRPTDDTQAAARLPWACELATRRDGETEIPTVRVYPGPREVIGGWAEWCRPNSGSPPPPYWELDQPQDSWCVVVRYRHPRPDWSTGGITNGEWVKPWYEAPELISGSPGSSGVRDTPEYRVFVLAWYSNNAMRQMTTGMLSVVPILDRAACLTPPEE